MFGLAGLTLSKINGTTATTALFASTAFTSGSSRNAASDRDAGETQLAPILYDLYEQIFGVIEQIPGRDQSD